MRSVTREQFWELMAHAYRDIAYEAHMKRFVPMKGSFWAKSFKKRWKAIDEMATLIAQKRTGSGIFCVCGHMKTNHKMPGGVKAFVCTGNKCECKKFKSDIKEELKPIMNGNKLVEVRDYPPGKIYYPVTDSFVDDPYESQNVAPGAS